MPIFDNNGKKQNVQDAHVEKYMELYPDATTIMERDGKKYRVKAKDYNTFLGDTLRTAQETPKATDAPMVTAPQREVFQTQAEMAAPVRQPMPESEFLGKVGFKAPNGPVEGDIYKGEYGTFTRTEVPYKTKEYASIEDAKAGRELNIEVSDEEVRERMRMDAEKRAAERDALSLQRQKTGEQQDAVQTAMARAKEGLAPQYPYIVAEEVTDSLFKEFENRRGRNHAAESNEVVAQEKMRAMSWFNPETGKTEMKEDAFMRADDLGLIDVYTREAKKRILADKEMKARAQENADALGIKLEDYVDAVAVPALQERMWNEWIVPQEEEARKNYNALGAMWDNSIMGMLDSHFGVFRPKPETDTDRYMKMVGEEAWSKDASLLERAGVFAGAMALDLPFFGGAGKLASVPAKYAGRQALKQMVKNETKKMVARGVSEAAAKRYANYAVKNGLKNRIMLNLATAPLQSGLTFGMFDAGKAALNMSLNDEWNWGELGKSAAGGTLLGGALGLTGAVGSGLTHGLTGAAKYAGKVAEFGVENAVFTEGGRLIGKLHGEQPENGWLEDYVESGATLLMIKAPNIVKNIASIKGNKEASEVFAFNKLEREQLAKYGKDLNAVLEGMLPRNENVAVEGKGVSLDGINEGRLTEEYIRVMNDAEIPMTTKAKLMAVVEGKAMMPPRVTDAKAEGNRVLTYDPMGRLVEVKEYKNDAAANKEFEKLQPAMDINLIGVLEDMYIRIKGYEADDVTVREWLAKNPDVKAEDIATIVAKDNAGEPLTKAEQKILDSLRKARRQGLNDISRLQSLDLTKYDILEKDLSTGLVKPANERTDAENKAVNAYREALTNGVQHIFNARKLVTEAEIREQRIRTAEDVERAAESVRRPQDSVKMLAGRMAESDARIDETANDGMVYTTTNNNGEKIIITGGKVVLDNEGFIDVNQSEGLVALMPDGTKKPVRVGDLREKFEVSNAEELKAVKRAEIKQEVAAENGWKVLEPGVDIEIAFDGDVYKLKVEGRDERGDIILSGEGESMAIPESAVQEGIKEAERLKVKGENEVQPVIEGQKGENAEKAVEPVGNSDKLPDEAVQPAVAEVPDFFRMDGKNYSVVSRNEDGSVNVVVDGKRTVLPAGTDFSAIMPTDKGGNIQYTDMPIERTLEYFVQRVLNDKARAQMIENNRKQAEAALKKFDKEPNVGTDPDAYEATMNKWEADKKAAQAKVGYWNEVAKRDAEITRSETRDAVDNIAPEVVEQSAEEFIANQLSGVKITPESFKRETGLSNSEQSKLVGVISNDGVSVERAAEIIFENYDSELAGMGFTGDVQDIRDIIIDVLKSGNPRSYAKKGRELREKKSVDQQVEQAETWANNAFGMTLEELYLYEETLIPRIIRQYEGFDEQEYYNNLAENYENDTTRESESLGRGGELLQGEQSIPFTGAAVVGEGNEGGEIHNDVQGGSENGVAQEEVQSVGSSEIPNTSTGEVVSPVEVEAERGEKGQKAVEPTGEADNSTVSQVSDQVAESGRRRPKGFKRDEASKPSTQELFEAEKSKFTDIANNEYAEVLQSSANVDEAVAEFEHRAQEAEKRAEDWKNRKYKTNNSVVTGVNPNSGADEYSTTIGVANERRRDANVRNAQNAAKQYREFAKILKERTGYVAEGENTPGQSGAAEIKEPTFTEEVLENGDKRITKYNSRGEVEAVSTERDGKIISVDSYDDGVLFETTTYDGNGVSTSVTRYDKNGNVIAESKKVEKIEDVGEVLAGARKDELKIIASSFENATVKSLVELPFSKAFKKPDLKKAVESGALREEDAVFYEAMFNALVNSSKPKNSTRHRNAVEKWAEETYNSLQLIKSFVEADEAMRDRAMADALADKFPAREEELAVIEQRKAWNARNSAVWGDKTTPNPVWVTHEVLKALGYKPGDKVEIPFGVLKANVFATGYEFYNKKGDRLVMQAVPTVEEGIENIVWLSKIKRGDADIMHPVSSFFATPTKRDMGDSGRYYVLYGTVRNPKRSEFGSKEEADAFAANQKEAVVRPIQEVVKRYGYKIAFRNPLTGDKFYVNDMEFETEGEAMQYIEENYDAVNEQTNELLAKERGEAKKEVSADDLLEVALVHGKDGWKYAVNIKGKYANNMGMPLSLREFNTRDEAKAFLNESKNEVFEVYKKQQAEQKKFVFFDTGENSRIGEDYRGGRDVAAQDFMDTFGFRGVQFGNWTNQADRQMAVNQAYDAFLDLAKLLGVSPKALSLNGELGMAFGSRGSGFGNAHYEPGEIVINLTKTRGAGSLAHEWWHALDNYFARRANVPMGMVTDSRSIDMRPELRQAYNELLKMIENSDFYKRSKAKGDYWGRMHEVTARLMAEWVDQSLKDKGELNTFLSRGVNEERYKRMNYDTHRAVSLIKGKEPMSYEEFEKTPEALAGFPYPSREELKEFGDAVRNIFDTVEEQETENGKVALFQQGTLELDRENPAFERATENVRKKLEATGVKVKVLTKEEAESELARLEELADMQKRTAPETASVQDEHQPTVVSSADGAKVLKDLDNAIKEYENKSSHPKTLLGDVARVLNAKKHGSNSQYATFEAVNGKVFTIRLANHNAKVSTFDNHNEDEGISIVVTAQDNNGIINDGNAHLVEFFYDAIKLRKADGKPLVEILKSIKQALYSGEYKDNTGLAQAEEVNIPEFMKVFHGSSAHIEGRVEFLRTSDGTTYGWAVNGTIYLTPEGLNPNTPIHEYTHLWAAALQKSNPKLWGEVVEAMKLSPAWNEVVADENYTDIHGDENRVASEVLSRLSGNEGYRRYMEQAEAEIAAERNIGEKVRKKGILNRIKNAVSRFWNWLKGKLGSKAKAANEQAEEAKAEPWDVFVNKTLKDFDEGVNPDAKDSPLDRMFIGKKGAENLDKAEEATTRLDNLNVAREMETAGKDAKSIKLATGWERGADGKWRYETEDVKVNRGAELFSLETYKSYPIAGAIEIGRVDENSTIKLTSLVKDDELFKAYPEMEEYYVSFEKMPAETKGSHSFEEKMIRINKDNIHSLGSTLVHEIQHAVQSIEGFAKGGNVNMENPETVAQRDKNAKFLAERLDSEYLQRNDLLGKRDELNEKMSAWYESHPDGVHDEEMDEYNRQYDELDTRIDELDGKIAFDEKWLDTVRGVNTKLGESGYKRLAGEVEARNAQKRMNYTEEQRRNELATETEDVSRKDQIFILDNLGVSASQEVAPEQDVPVGEVKSQPLSTLEKMKNALLEASAKNKENLALRSDALRMFGQDVANVLKLMGKQREYDKSTVDQLVKLAKMYFKDAQLLGGLTPYQVGRVMTRLNNAVGKRDITDDANELVNILVDAHNKELDRMLEKAAKTKAKKVNASGVEVIGKLDKEGQLLLEEFNAGKELDLESIDDKIIDLQNEAAEGKAEEAAARIRGLVLARQYRENILSKLTEIKGLEQELKTAEKDAKDGAMDRAAYKEFRRATERAILESKLEMVDAYHGLIHGLGGDISSSAKRAKLFQQQQIDHVKEIQHNANSDLLGHPAEAQGETPDKWNSSVPRFFMSAMPTFQTMLKFFGEKAADGRGYLYERFIPQHTQASHNEYVGKTEAREKMRKKLTEIFGKKTTIENFMDMSRKEGAVLEYQEGGQKKTIDLTRGQVLYLYMINKMADGQMKLSRMGITDADVLKMAKELPEEMVRFADWVQEEFLTELREKYNKVHERMFGAPMAAIESYFPIKINKRSRGEKIEPGMNAEDKPSTITGSVIKRTKNAVAIDLSADAMQVLLGHIDDMENWAAWAEFRRDVKSLLNYRHFQNQVKGMESLRYGSGEKLWKNFVDVANIAAGSFKPSSTAADRAVRNIAKGVVSSKITFRYFTAVKQILSTPAFWSEVDFGKMMNAYLHQKEAWDWAMKNLPGFSKRWEGRASGNEILLESDADWKVWQNRAVQWLSKEGMRANAFIDALTVATGAKAVFETKYEMFKKAGYSEDRAREKALNRAAEAYNESQQSSESAYLSPLQAEATFVSSVLTAYRNSPFGYNRKFATAIANLKKKMKKGFKQESIDFMIKQLMRDGLNEEQAKKFAKSTYRRSVARDAADVALYEFFLNYVWVLGPSLINILGGDYDEIKKVLNVEALIDGAMGGLGNLPAGETLTGAIKAIAEGDVSQFQLPQAVAMQDMETIADLMQTDPVRAAGEVLNILVAMGVGVNPQTFTDMFVALADTEDFSPREIAMLVLRLINAPNSKLELLEADEAMENYGANIEEITREYAEYQKSKRAPLTGWMYSDESEQKAIERYEKRYKKILDERFESIVENTDEYDMWYENSDPQMKAKLAKLRQKFLEGDKETTMEKLDSIDVTKKVLFGSGYDEVNTVYYELSTAEDEDMAMMIDTKLKELQPMMDEYKKLRGDERKTYREENLEQIQFYNKLNAHKNNVNNLKGAMKKKPEEAQEKMEKIRKIRTKAIGLINNYNE